MLCEKFVILELRYLTSLDEGINSLGIQYISRTNYFTHKQGSPFHETFHCMVCRNREDWKVIILDQLPDVDWAHNTNKLALM